MDTDAPIFLLVISIIISIFVGTFAVVLFAAGAILASVITAACALFFFFMGISPLLDRS